MNNKLLSEKDGTPSSARVSMMLCVVTACVISAVGVWKEIDLTSLGVLVGVLLGAGIGGKVMQKGAEK